MELVLQKSKQAKTRLDFNENKLDQKMEQFPLVGPGLGWSLMLV